MDQKSLQVIVNSFDFDHCLFNKNYNSDQPDSIITANLDLLNGIIRFFLQQAELGPIRVYNCIFSNRQLYDIDLRNSQKYKTESCFSAMQKVHNYLAHRLTHPNIEIILDTCLLSDSYHGISPGDTFNLKHQQETIRLFDRSKFNILYFQVNRIASLPENVGLPMVYRCFDDNYLMLVKLFYFTKLIVSHWFRLNIIMEFYKYFGEEVELKGKALGTGEADYGCYENVSKLFYAAFGFVEDNIVINLVDKFKESSVKIRRFEKCKSVQFSKLYAAADAQAKQDDRLLRTFQAKSMQKLPKLSYRRLSKLVHSHSRLTQARSLFFGDSIYHLIALSSDIESMKYFLSIGIDSSLMVNNLGETVMDLASDTMKIWLMISESEAFPKEICNGSQRKKYIELKLNFLIAAHRGNYFILNQIKDVLSTNGIKNLEDFQRFVTDDLVSLRILKLIKLWHEGDYEEDTISEEAAESYSEDDTSAPLPQVESDNLIFQFHDDQNLPIKLDVSEKESSYEDFWLTAGSNDRGKAVSSEKPVEFSPPK